MQSVVGIAKEKKNDWHGNSKSRICFNNKTIASPDDVK